MGGGRGKFVDCCRRGGACPARGFAQMCVGVVGADVAQATFSLAFGQIHLVIRPQVAHNVRCCRRGGACPARGRAETYRAAGRCGLPHHPAGWFAMTCKGEAGWNVGRFANVEWLNCWFCNRYVGFAILNSCTSLRGTSSQTGDVAIRSPVLPLPRPPVLSF